MEPGIHSIPAEQYFASDAVSNSDLKFMTPPYTPAHFRAYKDGLIEREETDALRIGSITHRCILEPDTVKGAFAIKPEGMSFTTKDGKAWKEEQGDMPIISQAHADMIARMIGSVWAHKQARLLISGSDRERSLFVQDGPVMLKSRMDCLTRSGNIIADLKTCELADLDSVERAIFKYGYYRQAAFYLRVAQALGLEKSRFVFIFVEKTPPHCVALYSLTDDALEAGRQEIGASIALLKHCAAENHWPGRDSDINEAGLPEWALKQLAAVL